MTRPIDPSEPTRHPDPAEPVPLDADAEYPPVDEYDDEFVDEYDEHAYDDEYDEYDEHEYATIAERRGGCGRWLAVLLLVALLGAGSVAYGWFWYQGQVDPSGEAGPPVDILIPQGATSDRIGVILADKGVISSSRVWGWYLRLNGGGPFQAGDYTLPTNAAMADVVTLLEAGPAPPETESFTIPEAFTVGQIVERLADPDLGVKGFSAEKLNELIFAGAITSRTSPAGQGSLEGLLFPNTYEVGDDATEQQVLQRLADEMDGVLDELDADAVGATFGLSRYEVLIVASLIEEEAKAPGDRAKISRVIHNRLEQGIALGIDATSRYEAVLAGRDRGDIDFSSDSPYNTRRTLGLPPTPIAAPGRDAIAAALAPEPGPWTYYVLMDAEGNHFFTDSNQEFLRAKEQCRQKGLGCG